MFVQVLIVFGCFCVSFVPIEWKRVKCLQVKPKVLNLVVVYYDTKQAINPIILQLLQTPEFHFSSSLATPFQLGGGGVTKKFWQLSMWCLVALSVGKALR